MKDGRQTLPGATTGGMSAALLMLICVYGFTNTFQSVAMNRVIASYGLTGAGQGIMSSMISVGCMISMLAAPLMQGRVRKMLLLAGAVALQSLMFLTLGLQNRLLVMAPACVLLGLGYGFTDTCCNSGMVDLHPENGSLYLGLLHGSYGVGSLVGPLVITALLTVMAWRSISLLMAAVMALACIIFTAIWLRPGSRAHTEQKPESRLSRSDVRQYLRNRRNMLLLTAAILYAATQSAQTVWMVRYMTVRFNAESMGSAALSAYWICATVSRFIAPRIRLRPLKLFIGGLAFSCVFQAIGVLGSSPGLMCIMAGCIGLASGQCIPMLLGESTLGYAGKTSLPTSVTLLAMCIARIWIPLLMGIIADGVSMAAAMMLPVLTGLLAALSALLCLSPAVSDRQP